MQILLVDQQNEWNISYPGEKSDELEEAIVRVLRGPHSHTLLARLSARFRRYLLESLEDTAVTTGQIEFAELISTALDIPIPTDAFHNGDSMWAFIEEYVGLFPSERVPRWLLIALARRASNRENSL